MDDRAAAGRQFLASEGGNGGEAWSLPKEFGEADGSSLQDPETVPERRSKRCKTSGTDFNRRGPFAKVIYNELPEESKLKLDKVLQEWANWHASQFGSDPIPVDAKCGSQIYYPVFATTSLYFEDIPQVSTEPETSLKHAYEEHNEVPLYDRSTNFTLKDNGEQELQARAAPRCFNCGSYSHAVRDCPKPRDQAAIRSARDKVMKESGREGLSTRYYQSETDRFQGLKPGRLGPRLREAMGLKELDPPPWLHRMRELGYPPGYLEQADEEDSGHDLVVFNDDGEAEQQAPAADVSKPAPPRSPKQLVQFPGINAPLPEGADERLWTKQGQNEEYLEDDLIHLLQTERQAQVRSSYPPSAPVGRSFNDSYVAVNRPGWQSAQIDEGLDEEMEDDFEPLPPGFSYSPVKPERAAAYHTNAWAQAVGVAHRADAYSQQPLGDNSQPYGDPRAYSGRAPAGTYECDEPPGFSGHSMRRLIEEYGSERISSSRSYEETRTYTHESLRAHDRQEGITRGNLDYSRSASWHERTRGKLQ